MSSFVVPESDINEIVTFIKIHGTTKRLAEWYDVVSGDPIAAQMLAQNMLNMNVNAVNDRYNENDRQEMTYKMTIPPSIKRAYKLLGKYLYQCCEGALMECDLFECLSSLHDTLAHEIARSVVND